MTRSELEKMYNLECVELLGWFEKRSLADYLHPIETQFHHLAIAIFNNVDFAGKERVEALRKLLESRDCARRAAIYANSDTRATAQ